MENEDEPWQSTRNDITAPQQWSKESGNGLEWGVYSGCKVQLGILQMTWGEGSQSQEALVDSLSMKHKAGKSELLFRDAYAVESLQKEEGVFMSTVTKWNTPCPSASWRKEGLYPTTGAGERKTSKIL